MLKTTYLISEKIGLYEIMLQKIPTVIQFIATILILCWNFKFRYPIITSISVHCTSVLTTIFLPILVIHYWYFKVYKAITYTISEKKSESLKMCCLNTHLTSNLLTLNKYCPCDSLYMIVQYHLNKILYNKLFFDTNFTGLLKIPYIHRIHSKFKI